MRDSDLKTLLLALRRIERERYLTLRGLAQTLGYSASYLSQIFRGRKRPGMGFVRAVIERYPEVRLLLAESLALPDEQEQNP